VWLHPTFCAKPLPCGFAQKIENAPVAALAEVFGFENMHFENGRKRGRPLV